MKVKLTVALMLASAGCGGKRFTVQMNAAMDQFIGKTVSEVEAIMGKPLVVDTASLLNWQRDKRLPPSYGCGPIPFCKPDDAILAYIYRYDSGGYYSPGRPASTETTVRQRDGAVLQSGPVVIDGRRTEVTTRTTAAIPSISIPSYRQNAPRIFFFRNGVVYAWLWANSDYATPHVRAIQPQ